MKLQILSYNIANLIKVCYNTLGDIMDNHFGFSAKDFSCHFSLDEKPDKASFKMHAHNRFELYVFLRGRGKFRIEGNEYTLSRGDIIIMRPDEAHYIDIDASEPYERITFHFGDKLLQSIDPTDRLLKPFFDRASGNFNQYSRNEFKPEIHQAFLQNITSPAEDRHLQLSVNLIYILNELYLIFKSRDIEHEGSTTAQKIVRYVNKNLSENISLDIICSKFYISKPQLCRIFKEATGSTVQNYISTKRLANARRLLNSGVPPVKVATLCGYNDYSAFYRAFCKQYSLTPKEEYRKTD